MRTRLAGLLTAVTSLALVACGEAEKAPPAESGPETLFSAAQELGAGSLRTYIEINADGAPTEFGVELTAAALSGLPEKRNSTSRCFDANGDGEMTAGVECEGDEERRLPLPAEAAELGLPFGWAMVNYNPEGHIPPNWQVPHFDFHFYMVDEAAVDAMSTGACGIFIDCEVFERAVMPVPEKYIPANYVDIQAAVGMMGNHLVDSTSPQLSPPFEAPVSHVLIYGAFDGRIIFIEPMVTYEVLASKPDQCFAVPEPEAVELAGYYPASYCLKYDAAGDSLRVSLESLHLREPG